MTLRKALLPVVDTIRGLAGPDTLDIRPFAVRIRTRAWSTGIVQSGLSTVTDVAIEPRPRVILRGREAVIGPVTPEYEDGGYAPGTLNPAEQPGVELYYVIEGPDKVPRPYTLIDLDTSRPFGYMLRLLAIDRRVPF